MEETTEQKRAMRLAVGEALRGMAAARLAAESEAIGRRVMEGAWWGRPGAVMLYWPMAGEVDVGLLGRAALGAGREVCLPRVEWGTKRMTACRVTAWGEGLESGRHGVMQPVGEDVKPEAIGLVIVPGIAFDKGGFRLGRGGGFYDRFLGSAGLRAVRIGVAFDEQIVEQVPRSPHDARMDGVVTPTRVWGAGG